MSYDHRRDRRRQKLTVVALGPLGMEGRSRFGRPPRAPLCPPHKVLSALTTYVETTGPAVAHQFSKCGFCFLQPSSEGKMVVMAKRCGSPSNQSWTASRHLT